METTIIQKGMGAGAGEEIKVLSREEIEKKISELDYIECLHIAIENYIHGYETGYCAISLETGNIFGHSRSLGEREQIYDGNYINLAVFYKDDEHPFSVTIEDLQVFFKNDQESLKFFKKNFKNEEEFNTFITNSDEIEELEEINPPVFAEIKEEIYENNKSNYGLGVGLNFEWDEIERELDYFYNF